MTHSGIFDPAIKDFYDRSVAFNDRRCPKYTCNDQSLDYWKEDVCVQPVWTSVYEKPTYVLQGCNPLHRDE